MNYFKDLIINPESELEAKDRVKNCPWNSVRNSIQANMEEDLGRFEDIVKKPPERIKQEEKHATVNE